jgi:hypothetical protein
VAVVVKKGATLAEIVVGMKEVCFEIFVFL